jgi:hypothetical protein
MVKANALRPAELAFAPLIPRTTQAITYLANQANRPSWPGGVAAAKPQTGWLFKLYKDVPEYGVLDLVIDPPPRRFAPPLLARRGDWLDLPNLLLP